ncbi:MAG: T9SS type A sorting domain-containing protein [Bacteroidota bacterium]
MRKTLLACVAAAFCFVATPAYGQLAPVIDFSPDPVLIPTSGTTMVSVSVLDFVVDGTQAIRVLNANNSPVSVALSGGSSGVPANGSFTIGLTGSGADVEADPGDNLFLVYSDNSVDQAVTSTSPLPVELTYIRAVADGSDVVLEWGTATETDNAGFAVEREVGGEWVELGFVEGFGTTVEAQTYSYRADDLGPGMHRFRLRQVDFDGAFEYLPVTEAAVTVPDEYYIEPVYPNPFNPTATFRFAVPADQTVNVALYDALGRQVSVLMNGAVQANQPQTLRIDATGLGSGTYLLRVAGRTGIVTQTLTVVK